MNQETEAEIVNSNLLSFLETRNGSELTERVTSKLYINQQNESRSGVWKSAVFQGPFEVEDRQALNDAAITLGDYNRVEIATRADYMRVLIHEIDGAGFDSIMPQLWAKLSQSYQDSLLAKLKCTIDNKSMERFNNLEVPEKLELLLKDEIVFDRVTFCFDIVKIKEYNIIKSNFYELPGKWSCSGVKHQKGHVQPKLACIFNANRIAISYCSLMREMVKSKLIQTIRFELLDANMEIGSKKRGRPKGSVGKKKLRQLAEEAAHRHVDIWDETGVEA